ncbi:MAG: 2-succinyl-5-enolpyruvyl-6-hydroxy-3-cyclohexene-1-carboxylic-acid synthase [Prolixibacteraceae bacterium]|nr:2-succinyl-5-enolpyruvyl-6-hydroxy-3-cyclohexene-1-carboxylic-acid synthase [Prolixibacteraceae bacterium]MBN2649531.1 2-succinyl-5-enolpyruvyl-6-hydroxy-3-cyclohexene-1-carboxylic-acid synthase [Prolixibacteraceae bacterium]
MIHHLQHIADLVRIFRLKGVRKIVVSPGSRNAPLIHAFASDGFFELHSIVDERSAAFYGLGISLSCNKPVALLCTSGSAGLNYAPALAEAYYRHVPLIAVTADRPPHLIGQQDNQTIRQAGMFRNFVKHDVHIELSIQNAGELSDVHANINEAINRAVEGVAGPVHLNVPLDEPLYVELPHESENIEITEPRVLQNSDFEDLKKAWAKSRRCLVVVGQHEPDGELNVVLNRIADKNQAVVLAEPLSNIKGKNVIAELDRIMMCVEENPSVHFYPDLLISMGGHVLSKRLKNWLSKLQISHYRISEEPDGIDTYRNLTRNVTGGVLSVIAALESIEYSHLSAYSEIWKQESTTNHDVHSHLFNQIPFSDLLVFSQLIKALPKDAVLHLGNSSPVRYAQLFDLRKFSAVYANRGVSGIDGCVSTAVGYASQSNQSNYLLLGDLSLMYDSNGLWNRSFPKNLKIVVVNNGGGGIFSLLKEPASVNGFNRFVEASTPARIVCIAKAFELSYMYADSALKLENQLDEFIDMAKPVLFEIDTTGQDNSNVYFQYIDAIKQYK